MKGVLLMCWLLLCCVFVVWADKDDDCQHHRWFGCDLGKAKSTKVKLSEKEIQAMLAKQYKLRLETYLKTLNPGKPIKEEIKQKLYKALQQARQKLWMK